MICSVLKLFVPSRLFRMAAMWISRRARRRFCVMSLAFSFAISIYITFQSVFNREAMASNTYKPLVKRIINHMYNLKYDRANNTYVDEYIGNQACVRPKLELWHPSMKQYFRKPEPLHCDDAQHDWVYVKNGTLRIYPTVEKKLGKVMCEYRPLVRETDDVIKLGNATRPFGDGDRITSDFFEIRCISARGAVYKNLHSAISPKVDLTRNRRKLPSDASGLNILMLGFDSVSRLNWMRNLPKSYDYYVKELGGIVLEGYNIVGDGTPQALLPILTGLKEEELPEARRGFKNAQPVDNHPWIWKDLKDLGYVTQWGEDGAGFGTFNYRMMGFTDPPVDHYMRPFYLWAENNYYKNNYAFCLGSKPRHINMLQWITHFFEAYPTTPKFSFLFHSEFSHDYFSRLTHADDGVLEFLKYMNSAGHLNNTLLILMSDHGARFATVRIFEQGKYEERLPLFSFRLPQWFKDKYPKAVDNLKANAKVLTTPFDIHATFHDVMHFNHGNKKQRSRTSKNRAISLFERIYPNRTCNNADIAPHWCTCMDWIETSLTDRHVITGASEIVKSINNLLSDQQSLCHVLTVDTIDAAVKFSPGESLLKFKQSSDDDGRQGDFSDKMHATSEFYQITITTKPGGGKFEATVKRDTYKGADNFKADTSAMSRINKYGRQPHCVMKQHPHLRAYCYCKIQLD